MRLFHQNIPNNNRQAVKILAIADLRANKGRNLVLAGTVALSILVLCTVFGISLGKVDAEYLQSVRSAGTAAATYLDRGTMTQYEAIKNLSYIEYVGREKTAGSVYAEDQYVSEVEVMDSIGWEEMTVPAYTHICGEYPTEPGEVMLSRRALESLGIFEPKIGMEIPMTMQFDQNREEDLDFILCGWYTDYTDPAIFAPIAYVSESQLEAWGMSLNEPDMLMIMQKNGVDGYDIEERLYEDIVMTDKTQQFVGGNTYLYTVINEFVGGYRMAAFCAILVLASIFLLIRNIFSISIQKEIRQIGLLNTLGTTRRQICSVYIYQMSLMLLGGCICGVAAAAFMVLFVVPRALGNLYLYNFGRSADLAVFRPGLFLASVLFSVCVVLIAVSGVIVKASGLSPLEAMHYVGRIPKKRGRVRVNKRKNKRTKTSCKRASHREIFQMAGKNLLRYRGRCILTVISLFLGITTALGSIVLAMGTDYTNAIERQPDFSINGNNIDFTEEGAYNDAYAPLSEEAKDKILSIKGIKEDSVRIVRGAYVVVDNSEAFLQPMLEALSGKDAEKDEFSEEEMEVFRNALENPEAPVKSETATVQIVDDDYIEELRAYAEKNQLNVDIESLKNGSGAVVLHYHLFSPSLQEEADALVGSCMTLWQLRTVQEEEKINALTEEDPEAGYRAVDEYQYRLDSQFKVSGYLDVLGKGFPELKKTWFGPGIWYFLVSEKGFERIQTSEKCFGIDLDVDEDMEPSVKAAIQQIIQEENRKDANVGLYVNCKSDDLEAANSYIVTNRIIMAALSFVLILTGVLNYLNIITTEMLTRRRELSVMESIGMTGKQICRMLMIEGGMYCAMVAVLVLTAGSTALYLLHLYMDSRIAYFKFVWPWIPAAGILAVLLILCVTVPVVMYRKMERDSLTQRIAGF